MDVLARSLTQKLMRTRQWQSCILQFLHGFPRVSSVSSVFVGQRVQRVACLQVMVALKKSKVLSRLADQFDVG